MPSAGAITPSDAIRRLSRSPGSTGIFTDFDGTLSPIVPDPITARPLAGAAEALHALAGSLRRVAIVSGRPAAFLADRFAPEPGSRLELFGLHGLERWTAGRSEPVESARAFVDEVARMRDAALAASVPDLVVEDKVFALTLHWRRAADPELTGSLGLPLAAELARSSGFELRPGKASVELVPPIGIDKGTVVRERGRGLETLAYLGDDLGDVHAFDALDDLEADGADVMRIAVTGQEAPPELLARADLVVGAAAEAVGLLQAVADEVVAR